MIDYSATEEATIFHLIFPFLKAKSPPESDLKIEHQPVTSKDFKIKPCEVRIERLKWGGGLKVNKKTKNKACLPHKSKKSESSKMVKFGCSRCDFKAPSKYNVKKHQEEDHQNQQCRVLFLGCVKCQAGLYHRRCMVNNSRNRNQNKSKDGRFLCNSCDYKSNYKQNVTSHQKVYHKDEEQNNRVLKIGCHSCEQNISHKRCESEKKAKSRQGGDYKCDECQFSTKLEESLQNHVQHVHLKIVRYSCSLCDFKHFYRSAVISHQKEKCGDGDDARVLQIGCQPCEENQVHQHTNRNRLKKKDWSVKCQYRHCNYTTVKQKWLMAHIQRVHVTKRTFKCPLCSYESFFKSAVLRHSRNVHGGSEQRDVSSSESIGGGTILRPRKNYQIKCQTCPFRTCRQELLKAHQERVHVRKLRLVCSSPGCSYRSYYSQSLYRHWRSHHPGQTLSLLSSRCELCDQEVDHQECEMKVEQMSDRRDQPHQCSQCQYSSNRKVDLAKHFRAHHPQKNQFLCDNCPYVTNYQHNLNTHISSKHQQNKLRCDKCDFVSSWRTAFLQHQREKHGEFKKRSKHRDRRMFLCEDCSYSTPIPKLFYSHQIKHKK